MADTRVHLLYCDKRKGAGVCRPFMRCPISFCGYQFILTRDKSAVEVITDHAPFGREIRLGHLRDLGRPARRRRLSRQRALGRVARGRGGARQTAVPPALRPRGFARPARGNRRGSQPARHQGHASGPTRRSSGAGARLRPERLLAASRSKAYLFSGVEIRWRLPTSPPPKPRCPRAATFHFPAASRVSRGRDRRLRRR